MKSKQLLTLYWSRRDFRLGDNPALYHATGDAKNNNTQFLPLYIIDPGLVEEDRWNIGYPRRRYLADILARFALQFNHFEILYGSVEDIFLSLAKKYKLTVYCNEDIEPYARKRDAKVKKILMENDGNIKSYRDQISVDIHTRSGTSSVYSVYSPFRKKVEADFLRAKTLPQVQLDSIIYDEGLNYPEVGKSKHVAVGRVEFDCRVTSHSLADTIYNIIRKPWVLNYGSNATLDLDSLITKPDIDAWYKTESEALEVFDEFNEQKILDYKKNRDDLGLDTHSGGQTSKMSVALKWGLVSSRQLKDKILSKHNPKKSNGVFHYLSELIWREFYRYVLFHKPDVLYREFQDKYVGTIEWRTGEEAQELFIKWIKGETGYRVVDAAMNQIAREGWMHNRSRMIVASILTKNLGIDWRWGQEYFRSILLDLDEASNNGGWQWAASVGADPKPIRIFNPYTQAEKYDSKSEYQAKYLPDSYYIENPLIEHKQAREAALERYKYAKEKGVRDY